MSALLALLGLVAAPASALGHGLGENAAGRSVLEYIPFGVEHMLLGWDHLLFIAGILLLSRDARTAAKLISVFVVGHSLTLLVATLAGWQLSATAVDVVIALSLAFVGFVGLAGPPRDWRPLGAAIFAFGLVHGLGLSTRLQDAGIPDQDLVLRVLAFNLGVEIGQLSALVFMVAIGIAAARWVPDPERLLKPAFVSLLGVGIVAATVLAAPSADTIDEVDLLAGTSCEEGPAPIPSSSLSGGHPPKRYFGPDERASEEDLGHIVGDGFVIVRYDPALPTSEQRNLRRWMQKATPQIVAAPATDPGAALTALSFEGSITCSTLDIDGLAAFTRERLGDEAVPPSA